MVLLSDLVIHLTPPMSAQGSSTGSIAQIAFWSDLQGHVLVVKLKWPTWYPSMVCLLLCPSPSSHVTHVPSGLNLAQGCIVSDSGLPVLCCC